MTKKPVTAKAPAEQVVKDIRRATRKLHSSEEKIRMARTSLSPAFDMRPGLSILPDWYLRGVNPKGAATVRELVNRVGLSTAARKVSAAMGPTPGIAMKRRQISS